MAGLREATVERKASLIAGETQELAFFPGAAGPITVSATVRAGAPTLVIELHRPDGTRAAGDTEALTAEQSIAVMHTAALSELDRGRPWKLVVRKLSPLAANVLLRARFPGELAIVSLDKLNPMAQMAIEEVHPTVSVDWPTLRIGIDDSVRSLVANLDGKDLSEFKDARIYGLRTRKLGLRFAPSPEARGCRVILDIEFEDGVKIDKGTGLKFKLRDVKASLLASLTVVDHGLSVGLDDIELEAEPFDQSILVWLVGLFKSVTGVVRNAILKGLRKELPRPNVAQGLASLTARLCGALDAQQLLDLWLEAGSLHVAVAPRPRTRRGAFVTQPAPPPRWPIKHLVMVMMENRSFDHMLGALTHGAAPARPDLRLPNHPAPNITDNPPFPIEPTALHRLPFDPGHGSVEHAKNKQGLWVTPFRERCTNPAQLGEVMKFQPLAHVPTFKWFAEQFCVCTQWRSALPGQTWPNRLYQLSGTSGNVLDNAEGGFAFYDFPTICDVLQAQGVNWAYYKDDVAFLELYRRWTFDKRRIQPMSAFHAAIADDRLPTVTWVEPNISDFGEANGNDDHPPISVLPGQEFLRGIYNALLELPTQDWMLVITYDEHGGFFESVGPVPAPDKDDKCRSTGFRVPSFLVSPRVRAGSVFADPFEHTGLIRTILDAYCNPEPLFEQNLRVAGAASLRDLFDDDGIACDARTLQPLPAPASLALAPEAPAPQNPMWRDFKAQHARRDAAKNAPAPAPPPGASAATLPGASGKTTAQLEAVEVVLLRPDVLEVLRAELALTGWSIEGVPIPGSTIHLVPPAPIATDDAWNVIHGLRARHDLVLAEPLWETEIGWPGSVVAGAPAPQPVAGAVHWALDLVRAFDAWQLDPPSGTRHGEGIVIGHLDTGYLDHAELEPDMLLTHLGYDFVDDDRDPRDRMVHGPGLFPGHGTATASVIASRHTGELIGTAPAATLIPFRISRSVVHMSQRKMTTAIRAAVASGCHVISISAGGLWSPGLHRAIQEAERAGVIIVAAAGNYVPFVVWPAAYAEVIACGACDVHAQAWRWSSRGATVDITAPGVEVPVAQAGGDVRLSSGTSHATAMVAGAIATWLAFHGRDRLAAIYGAHNLTRLARELLARSSRRLNGDSDGMGSGMLDLAGLLDATLPPPFAWPVSPAPLAPRTMVASLDDAAALFAQLGVPNRGGALPVGARQPLADELAFHTAMSLVEASVSPAASGSPTPAGAQGVPAHASRRLKESMT